VGVLRRKVPIKIKCCERQSKTSALFPNRFQHQSLSEASVQPPIYCGCSSFHEQCVILSLAGLHGHRIAQCFESHQVFGPWPTRKAPETATMTTPKFNTKATTSTTALYAGMLIAFVTLTLLLPTPLKADDLWDVTLSGVYYDGSFQYDLTTGADTDLTIPGTGFIDDGKGKFYLTEPQSSCVAYLPGDVTACTLEVYETPVFEYGPTITSLPEGVSTETLTGFTEDGAGIEVAESPNYSAAPTVPEPTSAILMLTSLLAVAFLVRRRFAGGTRSFHSNE
jgi:hypothetical protein